MFGKEKITREEVDELLAALTSRVDELEAALSDAENRSADLARRLDKLSEQVRMMQQSATSLAVSATKRESTTAQPLDTHSTTTEGTDKITKRWYLAAPSVDGRFDKGTTDEIKGTSLFVLTTKDGINGSYELLASPDALATAMISVSSFLKPVCRISGNTRTMPRAVTTLRMGRAVFKNGGWEVTEKAELKFE